MMCHRQRCCLTAAPRGGGRKINTSSEPRPLCYHRIGRPNLFVWSLTTNVKAGHFSGRMPRLDIKQVQPVHADTSLGRAGWWCSGGWEEIPPPMTCSVSRATAPSCGDLEKCAEVTQTKEWTSSYFEVVLYSSKASGIYFSLTKRGHSSWLEAVPVELLGRKLK